ncbi:agrin [Biomphalaria pfeifferi]|uniref:Agrin n=1 Tax=Biomphalaria pfeifferi TaxID=112525 RepID=A0AAD8FFM2_BIOPF|nr:agrin [Biomphalaria pfeifferi]
MSNKVLVSIATFVVLCITCQAQDFYAPLPHPCDRPCPYNYNPVCASNGVTYPNFCTFNVANCKRPPWAKIWIIFNRPCPFYYND